MGDTQVRADCGSSRGLGFPTAVVWASLSLAECLGMQGGWGWLSFREQSPAGMVARSAVVFAACHTMVDQEAKAQAGTP